MRPARRQPNGPALLLSALAAVLLLAGPLDAATGTGQGQGQAAGPAHPPATPEEARRLVRRLQLEQRPATRTEYRWQRKEKPQPERKEPDWLKKFIEWLDRRDFSGLRGLVQGAAELSRILVVLVLGGGLAAYLFHMKRLGRLQLRPAAPSATRQKADMLFGLDLRPESLPAEPAAASVALFARGRPREALALLYRAALSHFIHEDGLPLETAMTELECEREVRRSGAAAKSRYFRSLTVCWIRTAYGHEQLGEACHRELAQGYREAFS